MKKVINIFELTLATIATILLVWSICSWFEVIAKNLDPNPQYSPINLFILIFGGI
jgi:hypothetical protein